MEDYEEREDAEQTGERIQHEVVDLELRRYGRCYVSSPSLGPLWASNRSTLCFSSDD